jgi:hypothetical protein
MSTRHIWRLARRPVGSIVDDDLRYVSEQLPDLRDGQFLLRVRYLSLDPAQRGWMGDQESYMPPIPIGAPMRGGVVGVVVASCKAGVAEGDVLAGFGEWADHIICDDGFSPMPSIPGVSLAAAFGTLGLVGPTAYFGLLDVGRPQPGETLVVSAAAGGVGQVVGQIGKIKGCRVIGIAGGPEKCAFVTGDLGFDACIDYKAADVGEELDRLAPDGVDVNFEQVGGPTMTAVLSRMRRFGRVALCGLISGYNDEAGAEPPSQWGRVLIRRLAVRGFIVTDFLDRYPEAIGDLARWMADGRIKTRQDIRPGLSTALDSLRELYSGGNFGKLLVEVTPE